jgi:hypothetical protein
VIFAEGCWPGVARHATHFLLLRQKNVSKEKATLLAASLRFAAGNLRCSVQAGSRSNSPSAQTIAIPDPPGPALLGASRRGGDRDTEYQTAEYRTPNTQETRTRRGESLFVFVFLVFLSPLPYPIAPCGWAEERRRRRIRARDCLSAVQRSEFERDPAVVEHRRLPEAKRRDPDFGSPFLW